jgi:hypothetical protein
MKGKDLAMRIILCVVLLAGTAWGQAAPTSRPATAAEVAQLRAIIATLQRQIASLKAENAHLRRSIIAPVSLPAGASTFTSRLKEPAAEAKRTRNPYWPNPDADLKKAQERDKAIAEYLAGHPMQDKMAASLWNGQIVVGMPEDAVELIGSMILDSEVSDTKFYHFMPGRGCEEQESDVAARNGTVVSINHDTPPRFRGVQVK